MNDQIMRANAVDLCVETFGAPTDPAILLIMGSNGSMDWWEDEFCEHEVPRAVRDIVVPAILEHTAGG